MTLRDNARVHHHTPQKHQPIHQETPTNQIVTPLQDHLFQPKPICNHLTRSLPSRANAIITGPSTENNFGTNSLITRPSATNNSVAKSLITRPLSSLVPSNDEILSYLSSIKSPCIMPPIAITLKCTFNSQFTSITQHQLLVYIAQCPIPQVQAEHAATHLPHASAHSYSDLDEDSDAPSTSSKESKTSIASTASDRQLQPRTPIKYNETLLKCLHGKSQVKTLKNVSIPLPIVSESEDSTDEEAG